MRYFFNIRDARGVIRDEEGMELADPTAAHDAALASARDIVMEDINAGATLVARWIEVADEKGRVLKSVYVLDATKS